MRRGDADETLLVFILLLFLAGGIGYAFHRTYEAGYRNGQIDAFEDTVLYTKIETDEGIFWYRVEEPETLYSSRKNNK